MMKRILSCFLVPLLLLTCLSGCGGKPKSEYYDYDFFAMDTFITLRFARCTGDGAILSEEALKREAKECAALLTELESVLSAHKENASLWQFNKTGSIEGDDDLLSALDTALLVSRLTDGAYDPTTGGLIALWNITGGGPVPTEEAVAEALIHVGTDKIGIDDTTITKNDPETKLDLGGIGKGYAAERIIDHLSETDIPYGLISLGGNIGVFGNKTTGERYKVGLTDPNNPSGVIGYLYISEGFLSVSGDYERYFEADGKRYHHILDPKTGTPSDSGLRSAACLSPNGGIADALSTALFVMGAENALKLYRSGALPFEAVLVTDQNEIILTDGLLENDIFELSNDSYTVRNPD